jgi:tetratricopeptide (TPR) repeat protein
MKVRAALPLLCLLLGAALPCIWDYDTLAQERSRFPTTLELISGRFPRHSETYYRWRISDREERMLAGDTSPEVYDDLAVGYSKLGQDARAIELMQQKEALHPGLYETAANLGTFHIHAGHLDEGAAHILRAIKINPDAHFGREIYQELLVHYVIHRREQPGAPRLPLTVEPVTHRSSGSMGFWTFLQAEHRTTRGGEEEELQRAVRGVLGMMRFGNHDSPVLLEALSDLLLADQIKDAKRLAARALLKASYSVEDEPTRLAYRNKAREALRTQTPDPSTNEEMALEKLEHTFALELEDGERETMEMASREAFWIENGEDVDSRFADVFLTTQSVVPDKGRERYNAVSRYGKYVVASLLVIGAVALFALSRR